MQPVHHLDAKIHGVFLGQRSTLRQQFLLELTLGKVHLLIVDRDVHGIFVVQQTPDVTHGRVDELLLFVQFSLLALLTRKRARIGHLHDFFHRHIADARDVHELTVFQVASVQEPV